MDQRIAIPAHRLAISVPRADVKRTIEKHRPRFELWTLSFVTVIFAGGALAIVIWDPRAMMLALAVGLLALVSRYLFVKARSLTRAHATVGPVETAASSTVATSGLLLALVVVIPLLAFAVLWLGLLAIIGVMWLLHLVGLA